ncbi:MAG: hypothetical protein ACRCXT_05075, partial [Paraclostridium sp.]
MKNLEMQYQKFYFTGLLKINEKLESPKVTTNDKGTVTENHGVITYTKGNNAQGNPYVSRKINAQIVCENGDAEYLDISDYQQAGMARTSMFRSKGTKDMTRIDYALASDPNVISQCENFLIIKFEAGDIKFETLDMGHLIDFIEKNRDLLNGKRVVVSGNAQVSEYDNNLQLKYKLASCRSAYDAEVDGLKVDVIGVYTKNCIKAPTFAELSGQEIKKVPVSLMLPITNKDKSISLVKTGDTINLNVDMIDFTQPQSQEAYNFLTRLLNFRTTIDPATKKSLDLELEDFKYYQARFVAYIKSNKKDGELKEEELTLQEKFYFKTQSKTLEDIKKDRGIKKTTNKMIVIDAIPYDVEEITVSQEQLSGKPTAPASVSANQAFAQ